MPIKPEKYGDKTNKLINKTFHRFDKKQIFKTNESTHYISF